VGGGEGGEAGGGRRGRCRGRQGGKIRLRLTYYHIETVTDILCSFQPYRDGKRVLECLQRALRVADACMDTAVSVELFVEILNRYVYYFDQENDAVTTKYLNGLIELIHSNLNTTESIAGLESPKKHFQRTLQYVESRAYEGVVTTAKA